MGVMYAALSVAALLREAALKIETHTFMGNHKYIDIFISISLSLYIYIYIYIEQLCKCYMSEHFIEGYCRHVNVIALCCGSKCDNSETVLCFQLILLSTCHLVLPPCAMSSDGQDSQMVEKTPRWSRFLKGPDSSRPSLKGRPGRDVFMRLGIMPDESGDEDTKTEGTKCLKTDEDTKTEDTKEEERSFASVWLDRHIMLSRPVKKEIDWEVWTMTWPRTIVIGPVSDSYIYHYEGEGAYKCVRDSDTNWKLHRGCGTSSGKKLWLKMDEHVEYLWKAFEAPDTAEIPYSHHGDLKFCSLEDVLQEGWHTWRVIHAGGQLAKFKTMVLDDYKTHSALM